MHQLDYIFQYSLCVSGWGRKEIFSWEIWEARVKQQPFLSLCSGQGRCFCCSRVLSLSWWLTLGRVSSQAYNCLIFPNPPSVFLTVFLCLAPWQRLPASVLIELQLAGAERCQLVLGLPAYNRLLFQTICDLCVSSSSIRNKGSNLTETA